MNAGAQVSLLQQDLANLPKKASGGSVFSGKAYQVGEK
jgi:hypothetical protein